MPAAQSNGENKVRKSFTFRGIIQGVGFRPTVYRAAVSLDLAGYVQNRRSEVVTEIEGPENQVNRFLPELDAILPSAAEVTEIMEKTLPVKGEMNFIIAESKSENYTFPPIPPDLAICAECARELFDPQNRRYLYPFITCTQCGPRYSVVEDTPFDRETTSMIDFPQCPECLKEYTDPMDRRFHSQTNSCAVCGPRLSLVTNTGTAVPGDPVLNTIRALAEGKIAAIQGIGGFHLAVYPFFENAVLKLRQDKERKRKPFALMVRDLSEAERLCRLTEKDCSRLKSPESPILIIPEKPDRPEYLRQVSETGTLGLMLPYTPLHLLLFFHPEAEIPYRHLIMTSGNYRGEPILTTPEEVQDVLGDVADLILYNNRRIIFRNDDSVLRSLPEQEPKHGHTDLSFLRRSRGYVPRILSLHTPVECPTLALGGDLKSAPAFAREKSIYLSPYIGDLENQATFTAFEAQIDKILRLYQIEPERLVYDLHPDYYSTRWAEQWASEKNIPQRVQVQHHHAHILSVMAEHNLDESLGLSFDGTGFGPDGTIWGGEFLHVRRDSFTRIGRFSPFLLPGGNRAVLHPRRTAFALLCSSPDNARKHMLKALFPDIRERDLLLAMVEKKVNSPETSSLGRIFDAAAAVLGIVDEVSYEGEGPIKMEGLALKAYQGGAKPDPGAAADLLPFAHSGNPSGTSGLGFEIDSSPLITYLAGNRDTCSVEELSLLFHQAVSSAACRGAEEMRKSTEVNVISLSGGVFQNMLLRRLLVPALKERDFKVFLNKGIPPGDGGIALGQAFFLLS